jgi:succinyl-diaminopimelate desuccinylase
MDSANEQANKISRYIDSDPDYVVRLTGKLVRCESINPPGDYAEISAIVREEMNAVGLETQTLEGESGRTNVVGKLRGTQNGGRNLCLTSHTDVVPPGDVQNWKRDPFLGEVIGHTIWGRGTADSKGQLASMLAGVKSIINSDMKLNGDLYVAAPVDDETAGKFGLRYLFSQKAIVADGIVFGEATGFGVAYTFKARMWFKIKVSGSGAHGAFPDKGINSIENAYKVIRTIKRLNLSTSKVLGRPTINLGMISAGNQPNMVPESCTCTFDVRWGPPLTADQVKSVISSELKKLQKSDKDLRAEIVDISEIRDPFTLPKNMQLVKCIDRTEHLLLKRRAPLIGWYSSGDVYHVIKSGNAKEGVIFGPGIPWMAHHPNECIEINDLRRGAKLYGLISALYCA